MKPENRDLYSALWKLLGSIAADSQTVDGVSLTLISPSGSLLLEG